MAALSADEQEALLIVLEIRFEKNMNRHPSLDLSKVRAKLEANPEKLWSLNEMEKTGGEPDVVGQDAKTGEYLFYDCSEESPDGRRSLCYDGAAWNARKANKPTSNAVDTATAMGIDLLTEAEYMSLQKLGKSDMKTSSWRKTPAEVRELGGAIFGDRRFGRIFVYHNGAESYYGARGFRGWLRV